MAEGPPAIEKNKMKAAFAKWNNRIAPLFDTTGQVCIVQKEVSGQTFRSLMYFRKDLPIHKALRLVEWEVGTLICGAISRPLKKVLTAHGILVIDYVAGDVNEVIEAWLQGNIDDTVFCMPGRRERKQPEMPQDQE
jgi:predicted Fe-Mo cluster-binding NifX family protein